MSSPPLDGSDASIPRSFHRMVRSLNSVNRKDAGAMAPFGHNGRFVEIARYSGARLLARSARNLGHRIGIVRLW